MAITDFNQLREAVTHTPPIRIAIAGANDIEVLRSAELARAAGLIDGAVLVGDPGPIDRQLHDLGIDPSGFEIVPADDSQACAEGAVAAVRGGDAQVLVKGNLDSASYFRAILDRDRGLRASRLLSNLTLFELPGYPKLLAVTDNAIVLLPDQEQKRVIIENTRPLYRALGITPAKVALVAAVEKENPAMAATVDAAALTRLNRAGELDGFLVEGPFGYDACISREAAVRKGLEASQVAGDPDLLLMPNLEAANILGKAFKYHAGADSGGLVLGARIPVVLNSRSDSAERRLNSLLLAKLVATHQPRE